MLLLGYLIYLLTIVSLKYLSIFTFTFVSLGWDRIQY